MKRMRITLSMAQWSVKLPALVALIATQVGLLASQVNIVPSVRLSCRICTISLLWVIDSM